MRALKLLAMVALAGCAELATGEAQLPAPSSRDVWVLVLHGSGDNPDRWPREMIETLRGWSVMPERVEWIGYDWSEGAMDRLSAAGAGQAEGRAIARVIRQRSLTHVHVIAHSAAAHVAEALEQELADFEGRPTLHLSLLDPFLGLGLDFEWGRSRVGSVAEFTDHWLNVGDGVPGTDSPITAAHVFDVTKAPGAPGGRPGHFWPVNAYLAIEPGASLGYEISGTFDVAQLREAFPPGTVEKR